MGNRVTDCPVMDLFTLGEIGGLSGPPEGRGKNIFNKISIMRQRRLFFCQVNS